MLTPEDKQWIVEVLDSHIEQKLDVALAKERAITNQQFAEMRDFIVEGRRQDRAWVKEELESFARIVARGFSEVHTRIDRLEKRYVLS